MNELELELIEINKKIDFMLNHGCNDEKLNEEKRYIQTKIIETENQIKYEK